MRIGLLSNFWYLRGGLEAVMFADARLLRDRGHEVAGFAAAHPLNDPAEFSRMFPPVADHGSLGRGESPVAKVATALRLFDNRTAVRAFAEFAEAFKPDLVHQHGTSRQLSPAVLGEARRRGIPTVLTLHDYSLRCPAGTLSRTGARECLTLSCAGHRYDRAIRFRCVHDSRAASALAAAELLIARALRRYERSVDAFVVPSAYVAERMFETGLPKDRITILPNAIEPSDASPSAPGATMVAYGRLVAEKGFDTVVEVARRLPGTRFVIAGDGPERPALEQRANGLANVEFAGRLDTAGIDRLLESALAVIVPSSWPEPFGMVVLEAWRANRVVVVARSGALPEIVEDGHDGVVVEPEDVDGFVAAVTRLVADPYLAEAMGLAGGRAASSRFSSTAHVERLEALYRRLA
jgi:glycosyltransferase involved in cell wall biosynthesis